jgi:hypothetical protein
MVAAENMDFNIVSNKFKVMYLIRYNDPLTNNRLTNI